MEEDLRALEAIREAEAALQERFARAASEAARIVADARKEAARIVADVERSNPARQPTVTDVPSPFEEPLALPPTLDPLIERLADEIFDTLRKEEG